VSALWCAYRGRVDEAMYTIVLALVGLSLSAVGSIIVVAPIAKMSKEDIEKVSGTYWAYNKHLRNALLEQRLYAAVGIVFIALGTGFQTLASLM